MLTKQFLEKTRQHLIRRKTSKLRILHSGGQQAISHTYGDVIKIDFALKRIDHGQYGLCVNCGVPIDLERLKIIPETPMCTDCAKGTESH